MRTVDGRAVKRLRASRKWTQAELARVLGTDPVTVSRWERGVSHPRPSLSRKLAQLLPPPKPRQWFAADPETRLRDLDRAVREQLELKRKMGEPR